MTLASRLHWRVLIGTILGLMAAAWLAPALMRAPDIQENRVLAAKPAWPTRLAEVRAYRKAADAYVADHFPARPHLIGVLNRVRMVVGVSGSNRVIVGRDGWLFFDDDTHLGAARGDPPMTSAEVRNWLTTLAGRTEALRTRGVPYLVVSPPVKETIYPQHGPWWFQGPSPRRPAIFLPRLARDAGAGEVLYLHPELAAATRRGWKTFSLHDTHWTGYGAYAGYVGLIDRLHAMGLTDAPRPLSEFQRLPMARGGPRDLALMLGVASFVDLDYPHFDDVAGEAKIDIGYLGPKHDWTAPQVVDTGNRGKPVLLMTRDSFSNELLPFLFGHFSRIVLAHNQDGFWRPDLIDRFKPDIVLLEVIEPGLRVGMGEGPKASAEAVSRIDHALGVAPASDAPGGALMARLAPPDAKAQALMAAAAPTGSCNFEVATLAPGKGGEATFTGSGWISETAPHTPSPQGFVALKGTAGVFVAPVTIDKPRPDVAAFFKNPAAGSSGFVATLFIAKLPAGAYAPSIYRRTGSGWIACLGKQSLMAP